MKRTDRTILLLLPAVALAIGFYMLVISPKQKELGELTDQVEAANTRIAAAETQVSAAEQARKAFAANYSEIVALGSAVPEDSDQATLIYDLTKISGSAGVQFRSFELADASELGETAPAAATTTTTPPTEPSTDGAESSSTTVSSETGAVPTEAAAAVLPIGAAVGPAGLPVMPYKLRFNGSFFDMSDFFAELDKSVEVVDTDIKPDVRGRLLTVNGFAMVGDPVHGFPLVQASLALNTYIVPADQGLSGGATPAGPSVTDEASTVTSASTSSAVPGAATVSP